MLTSGAESRLFPSGRSVFKIRLGQKQFISPRKNVFPGGQLQVALAARLGCPSPRVWSIHDCLSEFNVCLVTHYRFKPIHARLRLAVHPRRSICTFPSSHGSANPGANLISLGANLISLGANLISLGAKNKRCNLISLGANPISLGAGALRPNLKDVQNPFFQSPARPLGKDVQKRANPITFGQRRPESLVSKPWKGKSHHLWARTRRLLFRAP